MAAKMNCGECIVKNSLFCANLFFALVGLIYMGFGIGVQLQIKEIVDLADNNLQAAPIASIVVGAVVFFVASLGCCGAVRESRCMLISYGILVLILMVIKLALAILIFVTLDDIVDRIPDWLNSAFANDPIDFQDIERSFECCGPDGDSSYGPGALSNSCCPSPPCTTHNAYSGCNSIVQDYIGRFGLITAGIALLLVAIEWVAALFALCLSCRVRDKRWTHF